MQSSASEIWDTACDALSVAFSMVDEAQQTSDPSVYLFSEQRPEQN